jgi:hypothetical protein
MSVMGCRFGDDEAGEITFSIDDNGGHWNVHIPGTELDSMIRATCVAPDTCEVGDVDSGVFFESKACFEGIGAETLVDALYLCSDFTANGNDLLVCP